MSVNSTVRAASGVEHRPDAGHEVCDLGQDRLLIAGPDQVVGAGQLHVSSIGDVLGQVPTMLDGEARRLGSVDDQRRRADRRQDIPNVALVDQANDRLGAARSRCASLVARPIAPHALIVRDRRSEEIDHHRAAGVVFSELEVWCKELVGCADGEVWCLEEMGEAIDEDQAGDSFWMRRGEGHREDATTDVCDDRRLFRTDRIEDGGNVLHELFERRQRSGGYWIREPGAALVEHDQAPERGQPFAKRCQGATSHWASW